MRGDRLNDFAETRVRLERAAAGELWQRMHAKFHPPACAIIGFVEGYARLADSMHTLCTAELQGHARTVGIRRWVAIMQSLGTLQEQAPVYISQPLSPLGSPAGEGDWQTLTQVRTPLDASRVMSSSRIFHCPPCRCAMPAVLHGQTHLMALVFGAVHPICENRKKQS